MLPIADTPEPPYYAVIFTSLLTDVDEGYSAMAEKMVELAMLQPGFLGVEYAREGLGRTHWYSHYKTRIAKVERDYGV